MNVEYVVTLKRIDEEAEEIRVVSYRFRADTICNMAYPLMGVNIMEDKFSEMVREVVLPDINEAEEAFVARNNAAKSPS